MSKIAILHFGPIELYPPVQNLLRVLESENNNKEVYVFTTHTNVPTLQQFVSNSDKIKIIRLGISAQNLNHFKRYISYFLFYLGGAIYLLWKRPSVVFYYETISSYPAYLYKRFFNAKAKIFIHYHEYISIEEYATGMSLNKYFYKREKYLYPLTDWVSQTNEYRLQKFLKSIEPVTITAPKILPNYPPISWYTLPVKKDTSQIKTVYVGALSLDTMYIREFAQWVVTQNGKVTFDIYSYNITQETISFLRSLQSNWIIIKGGVDYEVLPLLLKQYDIGVILYKGHIDNYIYNAPNKLFEYLACDLDVWFPEVMKGSFSYITENAYPKVIAIQFEKLATFDVATAVNKTGAVYKPSVFYCEKALSEIVKAILAN